VEKQRVLEILNVHLKPEVTMQCECAMSSVAFPAIDIFSHYPIKGTFLENPVIETKISFSPHRLCLKHFSFNKILIRKRMGMCVYI
jgi:hypothetical protein